MLQFVVVLCVIAAAGNVNVNAATDYETSGLNKHNEFRPAHHSPAARFDSTLNTNAQKCAQYYADKGTIDHSCPYKSTAGENLYMSWWSGGSAPTCATVLTQASQSWYDEVKYYDFNKPGFSAQTGHFTQLVWKESTLVGFGCRIQSNTAVAVALYSPHGNVLSGGTDAAQYFRANVLPK